MRTTNVGVDTFREKVKFEVLFTRGDNEELDRLVLKGSHFVEQSQAL